MFYRNIISKLEHWKDKETKKAFILQGARQTGKTFIINWFCKENFESFVSVNLLTNKLAREILLKCENIEDIIIAFSVIFANKLIKGKTVIFLDEVQNVPEIITFIKELVIDGSYKYILCGSLLGLTLRQVESVPVGYAELHTLYPFSFEEFLLANNVSLEIITETKNRLKAEKPLPESIYKVYNKYFQQFLIIGGMPSVIEKFIEQKDYEEVFLEQQYIIALYKEDFTKYELLQKKLQIQRLYSNIPSQLKKEYNRFTVKELSEKTRFEQIESSIDWLTTAGCAYKINLINDLIDGIKQSEREAFKLYLSDIGLLLCQYGKATRNKIIAEDTNFNFGYVYENFACVELIQRQYNLFYYNSKKHGEVDFIYEDKNLNSVVPIEIKSGTDYKKHHSLNYVLSTYNNIKTAYVFANCNIERIDKILYLPIFMISFLAINE
ncbi:MAG: AAA family ATPase [Bacillales bacterium]|jgi:predicted AAA+ superfamily ATPase|nr:AAA family ATPase [Bacillales bacterium]